MLPAVTVFFGGIMLEINENREAFTACLPERLPDANKGTYGRTLIIAGSEGMSGASYLASLAAYRSGSGLVKLLTHEANRIILQTQLPEAILETYDAAMDAEKLKGKAEAVVSWANALVLGPGLSVSGLSRELFAAVLEALEKRLREKAAPGKLPGLLLIDADGLNILAADAACRVIFDRIAALSSIDIVITPHPMEMLRLLKGEAETETKQDTAAPALSDILADPAATAAAFSERHHCVTLLKGSCTVVSDRDGETVFRNTEPSPALSKGGSGDVLSGTIAGIWQILRAEAAHGGNEDRENGSSGSSGYQAAVLGMLVHAEAGRQAAERYGMHGVLAGDTAALLGTVIDSLTVR